MIKLIEWFVNDIRTDFIAAWRFMQDESYRENFYRALKESFKNINWVRLYYNIFLWIGFFSAGYFMAAQVVRNKANEYIYQTYVATDFLNQGAQYAFNFSVI